MDGPLRGRPLDSNVTLPVHNNTCVHPLTAIKHRSSTPPPPKGGPVESRSERSVLLSSQIQKNEADRLSFTARIERGPSERAHSADIIAESGTAKAMRLRSFHAAMSNRSAADCAAHFSCVRIVYRSCSTPLGCAYARTSNRSARARSLGNLGI